MESATKFKVILVTTVAIIVALIAWYVFAHPWISLSAVLVAQVSGMLWAWHELTAAEKVGFTRLWMSVCWPVTAFAAWIGRVQ